MHFWYKIRIKFVWALLLQYSLNKFAICLSIIKDRYQVAIETYGN